MKYENKELLTPKELREAYSLEEDEDLNRFVHKVNSLSKGSKIVLIQEEESQRGDSDENYIQPKVVYCVKKQKK